ncbi:hypothetical protein ACFYY8_31355 [Streptosporangium sp. NPDC001559]|uniref:hypothetical protein n=1 Tax=Streptosporangium sp. NPDC001559 TaxID=3366187 RepID=UPI0036E650B7
MTRQPPVIDELRDRIRRLEAERIRPERPLPRQVSDLDRVIALLERLLTRPGPPDPIPVPVRPQVGDTAVEEKP